ncbi:MAG: SDR family oxidoreductase [Acidobacteria bacterium]|nr:SDR family oxidoreductase [Acidobacteriota bacterium]
MKQENQSLKGKVTLVTAGTGLIGSEIVKLFSAEGARVVFSYHSNESKAQELSSYGKPYKVDLNNIDNLHEMLYHVYDNEGALDILVNNYGPILYRSLAGMQREEFITQVQQNLYPTFFACKYATDIMTEKGRGRIINIAAAGAGEIRPKSLTVPYYIAKNAVVMVTKSFAHEYADSGITVNAVSPGILKNVQDAEKGSKKGIFEIPAGRKGEPYEVARVVLFLAQDESAYITGENIDIDGGWSL